MLSDWVRLGWTRRYLDLGHDERGQFRSRSQRTSLWKERWGMGRACRARDQFYSWMFTWKLNIAFVAVLVLYLTKDLMFNKANGKSIYHAFSMTSYFTGVIGAMIADSWLGKYKWVLQMYNTIGVISWIQDIPYFCMRWLGIRTRAALEQKFWSKCEYVERSWFCFSSRTF